MINAILLGTGLGLGLLAVTAGLLPRRPALSAALELLTAGEPEQPRTADDSGWAARLGTPAIGLLATAGLPGRALTSDLTLLGRAPGRLLAEQATAAVAGLLMPPAAAGLLAAAGLHSGWQLPALASLLLAAAGLAAPALAVRQEAGARRAEARRALAAYLDLVVISVAGGAGVEAALTFAADAGDGYAFTRIRQALDIAQMTRRPPWEALAGVGQELGITELAELASALTLAGTQGAKVRASLTAKASAMRASQLADAEAAAQSATERMSLPLVVLFAGYLALIGYPAIVHVTGT